MSLPRVIHVSPFTGFSGANRSMVTLTSELARRGPTFVFLLEDNDVAAEARAGGASVVTVWPADRLPGSRIVRWTSIVRALSAAVVERRIDLIHCHSAPAIRYGWPVARVHGLPLLAHQRDTYANSYFNFGIGLADHIVANSHWTCQSLPKRLRPRTTVVYNALALPPEAPPRMPGPLRVGMAARADATKGQDLLIAATLGLMDRLDFEVHIWGFFDADDDSPPADAARRMLAVAPGAYRDRFVLQPFRTDVDNFYRSVDVVVVPSRAYEGFGRAAIEAMAWRRPVIVADHSGLAEIVIDEQTGLKFRSGDAADLSRQLQRVLEDAALRQKLVAGGHGDVLRRFTAPPHAEAMVAVYEGLVRR